MPCCSVAVLLNLLKPTPNEQAHGPGEYFSTDANVSNSYAGSTGYLVVFLLLLGAHNTTASGTYRAAGLAETGSDGFCLLLLCLKLKVKGCAEKGAMI